MEVVMLFIALMVIGISFGVTMLIVSRTSVRRNNRVHGDMSSSVIEMDKKTFKILNGRVFVNDVEYGPIGNPGVSAPLEGTRIKLDQDGTVKGPIEGDLIVESNHPVTLIIQGKVGGTVQTNSTVTCGDVGGTIQTDGDVTCGTVKGTVMCRNVKVTGDIHGTVMATKVTHAR
jgi:cytoskeletal protein CcmA (bactofilin family)